MPVPVDDLVFDDHGPHFFNGIDANSGGYLFTPMATSKLADIVKNWGIRGLRRAREVFAELRNHKQMKDPAHLRLMEGIDASKLEQAGWGVIFPAVAAGSDAEKEQNAIYDALSPLLALRKEQATRLKERYYKEYRGDIGYCPGESKQKFLARLGVGPGTVNPERVPYFLLIVGSPQVIPYHVQYQLDVQYAVGRIHFDTLEEYANYACSVVAAETQGLGLAREVVFVGVANADDKSTQLSRKHLVEPLAEQAAGWTDVPGWKITRHFDADAHKASVSRLFGGVQTPALLFTGSHGMGFAKGDPKQFRHQGALLLGDWPGPKQWRNPIGEDFYLSADDLRSDAGMLGMIAFNFACYGAGTPEFDEFSKQSFSEREAIAEQAFVSGLHKKMLGHPKGGALAAIGHVDRTWGHSFLLGGGKTGAQAPQLGEFENVLKALMKGLPVGVAMESFNERYAEMACELSSTIEELEYLPEAADDFKLANLWTAINDARGYAVVGDPAVRLPLGNGPGTDRPRTAIEIARFTMSSEMAAATPASVVETVRGDSVPLGAMGGTREPDPTEALASELRASTRIRADGGRELILARADWTDPALRLELHRDLVQRAQSHPAEVIQLILASLSDLIKDGTSK